MTQLPWKSAWIVGASSGLGAAAATQLAAMGVHVTASARSADTLKEMAAASSGTITALPLDVSDLNACKEAVAQFDTLPDLIILNAAIYDPMAMANYDAGKANHIMAVNYGGVCNMLDPIMPELTKRGSGHLAIVASINGFVGLPVSAAYGPTKAALHNLAESLYPELRLAGVDLTVVNPGFIKTRLTAKNKFNMPQLMTAEYAAMRMIKGLAKKRFEVIFPFPFANIVKLLGDLPRGILFASTKATAKRARRWTSKDT